MYFIYYICCCFKTYDVEKNGVFRLISIWTTNERPIHSLLQWVLLRSASRESPAPCFRHVNQLRRQCLPTSFSGHSGVSRMRITSHCHLDGTKGGKGFFASL